MTPVGQRLLLSTALWTVCPTAPAGAADIVTLERQLVLAHRARRTARLGQLARRLGCARLGRALSGGRRGLRAAAIAAASSIEQGWCLIPALVALTRDGDRPTALAAARALQQICRQLRWYRLARHEENAATVRPLFRRLSDTVTDARLAADRRAALIRALAATRPGFFDEGRLLFLLDDRATAVRRAAIALFAARASKATMKRLARMVADDPDPAAARDAAVTLCAAPTTATTRRAAIRAGKAAARLASMVDAAGLTDDELAELATCLRTIGTAASRRALRRLDQRLRLHAASSR